MLGCYYLVEVRVKCWMAVETGEKILAIYLNILSKFALSKAKVIELDPKPFPDGADQRCRRFDFES